MTPVSRRQMLRTGVTTLVTVLAGCGEPDQERSPSPTTPAQTRSQSLSPPPTPKNISTTDIEFTATVLQQFTDQHPARIQVTFHNQSSTPLTLFGLQVLPFTDFSGTQQNGDGSLLLLPDNNDWISPAAYRGTTEPRLIPREPTNGCWAVDYGTVAATLLQGTATLAPTEQIAHDYTLLSWQNDACLPAGTYEFSEEHDLRRGDQPTTSSAVTVVLRLAITINTAGQITVATPKPTIK